MTLEKLDTLDTDEVITKLRKLNQGEEFYFRFPDGSNKMEELAKVLKAIKTQGFEHTFVTYDQTGNFHAFKTSRPKF
jgi:hypothetical protein